MRKKKRTIFRVIKLLFLLIGISFLVYGLALVLRDDFWQVKKISCQINGQDCPPELKGELMKFFQGENIFSLSPSEAAEKVKNSPLKINRAIVKKRFPHSLVFQLEERKPKVAIVNEGSSRDNFYLVDQEGVLLEKTAEVPRLPLIFAANLPEIEIGHRFETEELKKTIFLLVNLKLRLIEPKLARVVSSKKIEVWFKNDLEATLSLQKDLNQQLDSLQLIFSRTKIEGKAPKRIDLRFDKPVVSYD